MAGGGGKGGSQSTSVTVPPWLEQAAQNNLARADELSQIGYTPYYGPEVAGMTGTQLASMQNTGQAANAFGLASADPMAGMPAAETFAGGVQGYSSQPMYQQSLDALQAANPGQFAALMAPFINPQTGAAPASPYGSAPAQAATQGRAVGAFGGAGGGGGGTYQPMYGGPAGQGYTGLGDMINGGGPGMAGDTFSGGPLSGTLNNLGVNPSGQGSGMGGGKR